jgi:CBS domain-containing protein
MAIENQDYSNILAYRKLQFQSEILSTDKLNILHDEIIRNTTTLAFNKTAQKYGPPPSPFCFFVMGSAGRKEQGIWSDQDHGIIYGPDHPDARHYFLSLGKEISEGLRETGYQLCEGKVMASNPFWCRSYKQWQLQLTDWLEDASWESIRHLLTFIDSRAFLGEKPFINQLKQEAYQFIDQKNMLSRILDNTKHRKKAVGVLGQLLVESHGPFSGCLNIKESALYPYVNAGRLLAIFEKLDKTSTIERLENLPNSVMPLQVRKKYIDQFTKLQNYRLAYALHTDYESGHYLAVNKLSNVEKKNLKEIIKDGVQLTEYVRKIVTKDDDDGNE